TWDQRFAERPWISHPDPLLTALAERLPPGLALDLGCGPGRNAIWLAQRGWRVTGIDSSQVGLGQARDRAAAAGVTLELVLADLHQYPVPDAAFDLIVVANLHPGPGGLTDILQRATDGLVPGGRLFVVGHHLDNLGLDGPGDPAFLYTVAGMAAELPEGLAVDRLERVERDPGHRSGAPDAAVLLWGHRPAAGELASAAPPRPRDEP
ncbi:MAG TPA: class I SAM-dependent methyltransferase, partial [Candidatus Nanopelagicaceae bacterium]|nr:class I SAM-dependent methyltransferase [Candidatus Nanopelagicaceae bacterium]